MEERVFPLDPNNDISDFDILNWWKTNGRKCPILKDIAWDILAVPVCKVTSQTPFSTSGRVLGLQTWSKKDLCLRLVMVWNERYAYAVTNSQMGLKYFLILIFEVGLSSDSLPTTLTPAQCTSFYDEESEPDTDEVHNCI